MVDLNVLVGPGTPEISDDFEDGNYTGWSALTFNSGTVALAAGSARASSYGLRCDSANYSSQQSLERSVTVSAGGIYALEADYRLDTVPSSTGGLGLFYMNQADGGVTLGLTNDPDANQAQPWRLTILQKTAGFVYTTTTFADGPEAGVWCRLGLVLDHSGATRYGRLYKDGVLVATVSDASTGTVDVTPTAIVIGSYSDGSYSDCDVDNPAFYEGNWGLLETCRSAETVTAAPMAVTIDQAQESLTLQENPWPSLGGGPWVQEAPQGASEASTVRLNLDPGITEAAGVGELVETTGTLPLSVTEAVAATEAVQVDLPIALSARQALLAMDSIYPGGRGW